MTTDPSTTHDATTTSRIDDEPGIAPYDRIQTMIDAVIDFAALRGVVELGLFEQLDMDPMTSDELAALCQADPAAMRRLMRWLHGNRFVELDCNRYRLTEYGKVLTANAERSQRHAVLVTGSDYWWDAAGNLTDTICRGRPLPATHLSPYEYLAQSGWMGEEFDRFMNARSATVGQDLAALDLSQVRTVADLGGGLGGVLAVILREYPHLHGILADLPHVLDRARDHISDLAGRVAFAPVDLFDAVPEGAQVYVLSSVLHNYSNQQCVNLLTTVRHVLQSGDHPAEVWIVQGMLPVIQGQPSPWYSTDIRMLSLFEGDGVQDRETMFRLIGEAGLQIRRTNHLPLSQQTLMVAVPR